MPQDANCNLTVFSRANLQGIYQTCNSSKLLFYPRAKPDPRLGNGNQRPRWKKALFWHHVWIPESWKSDVGKNEAASNSSHSTLEVQSRRRCCPPGAAGMACGQCYTTEEEGGHWQSRALAASNAGAGFEQVPLWLSRSSVQRPSQVDKDSSPLSPHRLPRFACSHGESLLNFKLNFFPVCRFYVTPSKAKPSVIVFRPTRHNPRTALYTRPSGSGLC